MQPSNLKNFIRQLSKEKELEPEIVAEAIEQALITASRKNLSMYHNARPQIDLEQGQLQLLVTQTVVERVRNKRLEIGLKDARKINKKATLGDELDVAIDPSKLGRIAAESAKQVVIQRLRDAERDKVYEEYKDRVEQVVTGIVQRFERRDGILSVGKAEAILPLTEQPFGVRYQPGDRLKCVIVAVDRAAKGPQVKLSRTSPNLILRLFEQEVPEVADGTVKITAIARHPGVRTKIAVTSNNPDVDPVGACVGMRGSRVQMIVHEFENEKIDIIPFSTNPRQFINDALKPAKIITIALDEENQRAQVIVPEDNLALAIGQKGQNVQLASKLSGWKIDIRGDEDLRKEETTVAIQERYMEDLLSQVPGLPEEVQEVLLKSEQYNAVEKVAQAHSIEIEGLLGVEGEIAEQLIEAAKEYCEALQEMEEAADDDTEAADDTAEVADDAAEAPDDAETAEADPEGSQETEIATEAEADDAVEPTPDSDTATADDTAEAADDTAEAADDAAEAVEVAEATMAEPETSEAEAGEETENGGEQEADEGSSAAESSSESEEEQ